MEEIVVRITPDGKTTISVNGVKGASCKDLTKGIEKALGKVETEKVTGEYYEQEQVEHLHQN